MMQSNELQGMTVKRMGVVQPAISFGARAGDVGSSFLDRTLVCDRVAGAPVEDQGLAMKNIRRYKRVPTCLHCNKLLKERMENIYGPPKQPHNVLEGCNTRTCTGEWEELPNGIYQCSECPARYHGERIGVKGTGVFGYGSENLFCTLRCGYYYAVKVVQRERALRELA